MRLALLLLALTACGPIDPPAVDAGTASNEFEPPTTPPQWKEKGPR